MRLTTVLMALFSTIGLHAQQITESNAKEKAAAFANGLKSETNASSTRRRVQAQSANEEMTLAYTSRKDGKVQFYIYNLSSGGFVIVGGDEVAREILGYCETGSFDYDQCPDPMKEMLKGYQTEIYELSCNPEKYAVKSDGRRRTPSTTTTINPLLTTTWDQTSPYNCGIRNAYSQTANPMVGCVPLAMGQVMRYHKYPTKGIGSEERTYLGKSYTANYAGTTYNWSNMPNSVTSNNNDVGTLLLHCGIATGANWADNGTSTNDINVPKALVNKFGYDKCISYQLSSLYTSQNWENLIYNELSNKRPVIYGGVDGGYNGHCYIIDGYNKNSGGFHHNWGWGGSNNGYYSLTGGCSAYSFPYHQIAIIGISHTGNNTENGYYYVEGSINCSDPTTGKSINYTGIIHNMSVNDRSVVFGFKFVNKSTGNVTYSESYSGNAVTISSFGASSLYGTIPNVETGTYTISPVYHEVGSSTWYDIRNTSTLEKEITQDPSSTLLTYYPYSVNSFVAGLSKTTASQSEIISFGLRALNKTSETMHCQYALRCTNKSTNEETIIYIRRFFDFSPASYSNDIAYKFDCGKLEPGTYLVEPVYRTGTTWRHKWTTFNPGCNKVNYQETLTVTSGTKRVEYGANLVNLSGNTEVKQNYSVDFKFTATSSGTDTSLERYYYLKVTNGKTGNHYSEAQSGCYVQSLVGGQTANLQLTFNVGTLSKYNYSVIPVVRFTYNPYYDNEEELVNTSGETIKSAITIVANEDAVHTDATIPSTATKLAPSYALSNYNDGYVTNCGYIIDGKTDTDWYDNIGSTWADRIITFEFSKKVNVSHYKLTESASAKNNCNSNFSTWTIYASNDQKNWTMVTEENDASKTLFRLPNDNTSSQSTSVYEMTNNSSSSNYYRYYKLVVHSLVGMYNSSTYYAQMSEMEFYGTEAPLGTVHADATIPTTSTKLTISSAERITSVGGTYNVSTICDNNISTNWYTSLSNEWENQNLIFDLGSAVVVTNYKLTEGSTIAQYPYRNIATWAVFGSNDNSTWTKLAEELDETKTQFRLNGDASTTQHTSTYAISGNTTAYRYYKLTIYSVVSKDLGQSYFTPTISEIEFYGTNGNSGTPDPDPEPDPEPTSNRHVDATIPATSTLLSATYLSGTDGASAKESAKALFDADNSTKWCVVIGASWSTEYLPYVIFDMGKKVYLTHYKLTEGDDTYSYPSRNWAKWTIYGSNDQKNWTEVSKEDKAEDNLFRESGDATTTQYSSIYAVKKSSAAFRYYSVNVDEVVGIQKDNAYVMQMAEMALYGREVTEPASDPDVESDPVAAADKSVNGDVKLTYVSYSGHAPASEKEGPKYMFDGDNSTKWCVPYGTATGNALKNYVIFKAEMDGYLYPPAVTSITLTEGGDTHQYTNRNWKVWNIYGINATTAPTVDTTGWKVVKSFDGSDPIRPTNNTTASALSKTYTVNSDCGYNYYMIEVVSLTGTEEIVVNNSKVQGSTMQMAEIKINGKCTIPSTDVNSDGKVNVSDITSLIEMLRGAKTQTTSADVTGNGKFNIADLKALVKALLQRK